MTMRMPTRMSTPRPSHATGSIAFTLFEVVISMLVLSVATLATLAMLPIGIRAQQMGRSQLYASSTALSLMDSFHNPMITFDGHGRLVPELEHNAKASTPDQPPVPGWAHRLREANLFGATYAHDLERHLSGWITGVMPVPLEISRRLDSDNDEIQKLLDQGAFLYYVDPGYVRGLTVASARDKAPVLNPPPEAQKLVFAVNGFAQENAMTSHPYESWPWYELYPFPPAWVAMRAHGREYRRGPVSYVKKVDPVTGEDIFDYVGTDGLRYPIMNPREGRNMSGGRTRSVNDWSAPPGSGDTRRIYSRGGLLFGDGGHANWDPVWFDPAPSNYKQLVAPNSTIGPATPTDQTLSRIDPRDPVEDPDPAKTGSTGWYQGRNWRYFHEKFQNGTPWDTGWISFQRLAGFNSDVGADLTQAQYARLDTSNEHVHYERAGWLPVLATLLNREDPWWDAWFFNPVRDPITGRFSYPNGGAPGNEHDVGTGVIPPRPPWWGNAYYLTDTEQPWAGIDQGIVGAPASMPPPPTYEMRASYRDRAIALWNDVTASLPFDHCQRRPCAGYTPDVWDTQHDCDVYEYGPQELDRFPMVDPADLPGTPHPAQVLALSYLAHASMMMTGWDVPFVSWSVAGRLDWDILTWRYREGGSSPTRDPGSNQLVWGDVTGATTASKDAKIVAPGTLASAGSSSVQVRNDTSRDMIFFAGDIICFESDYRDWYRRSEPNPDAQTARHGHTIDHSGFMGAPGDRMLASCRRYRVRDDVHVGPDATGTLNVDPPLVTDIADTVKSWPDSWANPKANPPIPIDTPHPQQLIRVCNEHDRAFARKVHEMCMRWAARYCADNPYDWGAPRMMNHQVMNDKPLALLDLFEDAARGAVSDGVAQRVPQNLPTSLGTSSAESFYRWLTPPNQAARSWFLDHHISPGGPACDISHHGPAKAPEAAWSSLVYNPQLAPPSTPGASSTGEWNFTSDAKRYWLNRRFEPFHRGRELVFWSVDWKSYEDAESAPSAPLDFAKHARSIGLKPDLVTPASLLPMRQPPSPFMAPWDYVLQRNDSQYAGNPESGMVWLDGERHQRFIDNTVNSWYKFYWSYAVAGSDIVLGHWGADRNGNRNFDVGPVPASTRMRALVVARFNIYDPVLRLNVNN